MIKTDTSESKRTAQEWPWPPPDDVKSGGRYGYFGQPGTPQEEFLGCQDDIIIFGGSASGGKTLALLLDFLRFKDVTGFRGVIFRRLSTHITQGGGLWDWANTIYRQYGGKANANLMRFTFPSGATIEFKHLQHEHTKYAYQGGQFARIGFDEATHFSDSMVWYLDSRLRTVADVKTGIRLTCNPDAESWLAKFIGWWINPDTGYPIMERTKERRWLYRQDDQNYWFDSSKEAMDAFPDLAKVTRPRSVRFIPSQVTDNKILMDASPDYVASLMSQGKVDMERLYKGNWQIVANDGMFQRDWFQTVHAAPVGGRVRYVRAWDLAATAERDGKDPCWTAGVLMAMDENKTFYVVDVVRFRDEPLGVINAMVGVARQDKLNYPSIETYFEEEGGSGGKFAASQIVRALAGNHIEGVRPVGNKEARATPFASQAQGKNVKLANFRMDGGREVRNDWQNGWMNEMTKFPLGQFADQVDATSLAFERLTEKKLVTAGTSEEVLNQLMGVNRPQQQRRR